MPIPDKARVQELFADHQEVVAAVVARAWTRWLDNSERSVLYRRVRAGLIHNYMMLDAIPGLASERIKVIERPAYETALFLLDDELVFRFKKGDAEGQSSNIGTQAALDYNDPNECLSLFGLPDIGRVDVSYSLNKLETQLGDVMVVARDNDRVAWSFSILMRKADVAPQPISTEPKQPPAADTGLRIPVDEAAERQVRVGRPGFDGDSVSELGTTINNYVA